MRNSKDDNKITSFTGNYSFLAMEFPCEFFMNAVKFKSATAAFYAQKSTDINSWNKFARLNPNRARQKASALPEPDDYEENKYLYLYKANKLKFDCNELLRKSLCELKGKELINNVPYKEEYLGIFNGKGENMLGKVLMQIRDEYLTLLGTSNSNIKRKYNTKTPKTE